MKPMLLCRENPDLSTLNYPLYVSPKLDGIRCCIVDGRAKSRTLKDIPNIHIQTYLSRNCPNGLDGELIVGKPNSGTVYRDTNSIVMSDDKECDDWCYYVFDVWDTNNAFQYRTSDAAAIVKNISSPRIKYLGYTIALNSNGVTNIERELVNEGYEGVILRSPDGKYKFGRTTMRDQNTYKLKRFKDSEAVIIGFEEELHNGNEATTNELGRTQRATIKANLSGKGTLGCFILRDLEHFCL